MNAEAHLQEAYREWRRLAEAEGEGIRTRNWNLVRDCQDALQKLQPQIIQHAQAAQEEWSRTGADRESREQSLRATVSELVAIESHNNSLLNSARHAARARLDHLEQAGRTLRQVRNSYARPSTAAWTSLS